MRCRLGYLNSHGKEIYFGPPITITFIEKSAKSPISGGVSDNRSHISETPIKGESGMKSQSNVYQNESLPVFNDTKQ